MQTCIGGEQPASCCSLLVFKQNFHSVCFVPVAFFHQSLVRTVTAVSRSHTSFPLIQLNSKLCEVIATLKIRSTICHVIAEL